MDINIVEFSTLALSKVLVEPMFIISALGLAQLTFYLAVPTTVLFK